MSDRALGWYWCVRDDGKPFVAEWTRTWHRLEWYECGNDYPTGDDRDFTVLAGPLEPPA